jgi:UDP-glucose 4-epimerase
MVSLIAKAHGKKIALIPGFGWLLQLLESRVGVVGKVFGTLTYDLDMSQSFADAGEISFDESIRETEVE